MVQCVCVFLLAKVKRGVGERRVVYDRNHESATSIDVLLVLWTRSTEKRGTDDTVAELEAAVVFVDIAAVVR